MIAHRLFNVAAADLSVVIERGNIGNRKLGTSYGYKEILLSFIQQLSSRRRETSCKDWTHRDRSTNAYPTKGYISILRN